MATFAKGTNVSVERSRAELDDLLKKHGASSRVIGEDDEAHRAVVGFSLKGAKYRLNIPLPAVAAVPYSKATPSAYERPRRGAQQAQRERWRLVILLVKAKLEAVRLGLSTANREFMADLVTDDGRTLEEVLNEGGLTRLLNAAPSASSKKEGNSQ